MPDQHAPPNRLLSFGSAALLAVSLAGLWLASRHILPTAEAVMNGYGTRIPGYVEFAHRFTPLAYRAVWPIAIAGVLLSAIALIGRGRSRIVTVCRAALPLLAASVASVAIYLLSCSGTAYRAAGVGQMIETEFYKRALDEFALLAVSQNRLERLRSIPDGKVIEVGSAAEFTKAEARERISLLISGLRRVSDPPTQKRILATLALFRDRISTDSYAARDVASTAASLGAPKLKTHIESLEWIAGNLNKDGWEPLPLFKITGPFPADSEAMNRAKRP